jgi:hypothetical protein
MRLKVSAILLMVLVIGAPSFALTINELDANFSLMIIGNRTPSHYSGVSPIVQLIGASLPLRVAGPFFVEPMLELFGTYYEWTTEGTSVPTEYDTNAGFFTLGTLISLHSGLSFPVSPTVSLGGSVGLDFLLRFPIELVNESQDSIDGRDPSLGYFFGMGRFLYPETRFFMHWQISEPIGLVVNLRAFYPVFHFWDGLDQPFFDQFMFSAGLGIAIRLGAAPAAPK